MLPALYARDAAGNASIFVPLNSCCWTLPGFRVGSARGHFSPNKDLFYSRPACPLPVYCCLIQHFLYLFLAPPQRKQGDLLPLGFQFLSSVWSPRVSGLKWEKARAQSLGQNFLYATVQCKATAWVTRRMLLVCTVELFLPPVAEGHCCVIHTFPSPPCSG